MYSFFKRTKFNSTFILCSSVHSFGSITETYSARFDENGSRLLCRPDQDMPVIYNVPTAGQHQQTSTNGVTNKVQLTAPGYVAKSGGHSNSCFAGDDDELAIVSSAFNHNLFIWSVPAEGHGDRTIDQSLLSLSGHQQSVNAVRYCKATSSLASGDQGGVIKLWTPSISTTRWVTSDYQFNIKTFSKNPLICFCSFFFYDLFINMIFIFDVLAPIFSKQNLMSNVLALWLVSIKK